jgi:hypothetical protein
MAKVRRIERRSKGLESLVLPLHHTNSLISYYYLYTLLYVHYKVNIFFNKYFNYVAESIGHDPNTRRCDQLSRLSQLPGWFTFQFYLVLIRIADILSCHED